MSEYSPSVWHIIKIKAPEHDLYYRVLAGWYGGYAGSDSWKISSGINAVIDKGTYWEMPQSSGSVYYCYKESERHSMLTQMTFQKYRNQFETEFDGQEWTFEIVPIQDVIDFFKSESSEK
jgi:hypothetical protein